MRAVAIVVPVVEGCGGGEAIEMSIYVYGQGGGRLHHQQKELPNKFDAAW